ncbi:MAG: quinone-dependent dihydroorotate dehydrogenase [Methyloligellaceae bacterium]
MIGGLVDLARPFLFALDPERAHEVTLRSLEAGLHPRQTEPDDPRLAQKLWDLDFANPIGIAAGFDKDARVPDAILAIGFGFAEIGTVTPKPQIGNPQPRVFRLIDDRAVINRLGFNSQGHRQALKRLERRPRNGVVGVNIGANKETDDRVADYVAGLETFIDVADYLTVNVSSPNTPGLRDLQAPKALDTLLGRLVETRQRLVESGKPWRPLLVKLAPDIAEEDLPAIVERIRANRVDGIIVSNTTVARDGLRDTRRAKEAGGVSGGPLFEPSTRMLARLYLLTEGQVPLVGVGGIDSGARALAKITAGASLLQLYTGLIFEGPGLIERIKRTLVDRLERDGAGSIRDIVGTQAEEWTAEKGSEKKP